jgi:DNA-binding transcriptional MerR regulator
MPEKIGSKTFYRTQEACERAGISRATLFRWLKSGVIADVKNRDRRGWRLFTQEDIERLRGEAQALNQEIVNDLVSRYKQCYERNRDNPLGYLEDCAIEYLRYVKESMNGAEFFLSLLRTTGETETEDVQKPMKDFFMASVKTAEKAFGRAKERGDISATADTSLLAWVYVSQYYTLMLAKQMNFAGMMEEDQIRQLVRELFVNKQVKRG